MPRIGSSGGHKGPGKLGHNSRASPGRQSGWTAGMDVNDISGQSFYESRRSPPRSETLPLASAVADAARRLATTPTLPVNVLSDDVSLQAVSGYGQSMLTHLEWAHKEEILAEHVLRQKLHVDVDKGRDELPLTFLFEYSASASGYVAQRALDNVSRIIRRLLMQQQSDAWSQWVRFVEASRASDVQARLEAAQKAGGAGTVGRIFNRLVLRKAGAALRRWCKVVREMKRVEQRAAARTIQRIWRHYLGWWNFIKREKNKRANEQKRTTIATRLVLFEWLAKRRMVRVILARQRDILENKSARCIQRFYLAWHAWKSTQDEVRERRAASCLRKIMFRRRNAAFNSWALYSAKMKRCKQMFAKAMMGAKKLRFLLWDGFAQEKKKDRRDEQAGARFLRRLLNRRMAASFDTWHAATMQVLNLKRMMRRALAGTLSLRFDMWYDFAYETKMARLGEQERKVFEAVRKMMRRNTVAVWNTLRENVEDAKENRRKSRQCLMRMLHRMLAACFIGWRDYTVQMKNVRRMCKRALGQDLEWRFYRWSEWAVGEIIAKRRENERKCRMAIMRLMRKTMYNSFVALRTNADQVIGVRRMLLRALNHEKARCFDRWNDFTYESQQNNARAFKWFQKWWNKERARAFASWQLYTHNSIRVKSMCIRAIKGKRLRMVLAWKSYAVRCRVYKSQQALLKCVEKTGGPNGIGMDGLRDFPELQQDAFELLRKSPADVSEVQDLLLKKARKKIQDWYDLNELMALRVQCSWRCRDGRLSLFLARQARAERLEREAEERRRMIKAARLVQAVYRGRLGKKTLAQIVLNRKKEAMQKAYLLERQAKEARERWEHDQQEMIFRERAMREVEEKRKKEAAEWELEQKRRNRAWIRVPVVELEEDQDVKDLEEGQYYWYNEVTEETQWSRPENYDSGEPPPPPPTEEQILKAWKVVDDEASGQQYFYNDLTEETRWDPPDGFKVPPPKGKCSVCRENDAARHCKTCDEPFCLECFISEHATPAKRAHMFRVLKKATPDPFKCGKCNQELATYSTPNYKSCYCDDCFEAWFDHDPQLQEMGFVHFQPGSAVCAQCQVRLAEKECQQCDDKYCGDCSESLHRSGRKKQHTISELLPFHKDELQDGEAYCVECEHTRAALMCEQCGDAYCDRCYRRTHARGRKSQHTTITWEEAQTPWEEFWDPDEGRMVYFNSKTRERTFEKPAALLWGKEKMAWQEQHNDAVGEAKEAQDAMREMQRQMAEMQDKMAGMQKRRPGMVWGMLKKAAKVVAPSLAIDKDAREQRDKEDEEFLENYDHTKDGGSPGDAARARALRKKKRMKEGTNRTKQSLLKKALKNPKGLLGNPKGFLKEQRNEQSGLDERYLRKMLIGRQEVANDSNMSSDQRKDAELAAYESSMMSYLAKARAEGREMEFKQEVKNVKQMRVDEAEKIKAANKKKSRFR